MTRRGNRHEIVLATKFTSPYKSSWDRYPIHANFAGNSAKSVHVSLQHSLEKLQTDYVDLLYVHWWYVNLPDTATDGQGIILLRLKNWHGRWTWS